MTREDLISLLKEYKENKAKLNIKLKELKNARIKLKKYNETDTQITNSFGINKDIQSKNSISDKVLNRVIKNENTIEEIKAKIPILEKAVRELREKVECVEDRLIALKYKEKEILCAYYIDGRTYEDIGNNLYHRLFSQTRSEKQIKRIVENATEKMLKL